MMFDMKRYGEVCPLARGLDIIGERWSLLIVRELMVGPRRYTDLQTGLPGIGTNVLAARLKDLTEWGIVTRHTLPPPTPVAVYELTVAGRALGPTLQAIRQWGAEYAPPPQPDDAVRPAWVLMSAATASIGMIEPGKVCELHLGDEVFHLVSGDTGFSVHGGPANRPDVLLKVEPPSFYALASGQQDGRATTRRSEVEGDKAVGEAFLSAIQGAAAGMAGHPRAPDSTRDDRTRLGPARRGKVR